MIKKLCGLSDKSIVKKSTYYAYLFGAIFGVMAIISGIGTLIFRYTDTYKGMVHYQYENVKYLKSLSQEIKDERVSNVSELYKINLDFITEIYQNTCFVFIGLGLLSIMIMILFNELRNKVLYKEKED